MDVADLARWTPVRFNFAGPAPTVDWADLSAERFVEPFFDQTVARWATGPGAQPLVRSGLDALLALDDATVTRPVGHDLSPLAVRVDAGIPTAEHASRSRRCCRAFAAERTARTRTQLGSTGPPWFDWSAALVRALGRRRHGDEQHLVLKCTSWNIRRQEILAAAFPDTPWVWVQRDPAQVVASLLANPPGWLGHHAVPAQTALHFGIDPAALPTMTRPRVHRPRARRDAVFGRSRTWHGGSPSTMPICPPRCGSGWQRIS